MNISRSMDERQLVGQNAAVVFDDDEHGPTKPRVDNYDNHRPSANDYFRTDRNKRNDDGMTSSDPDPAQYTDPQLRADINDVTGSQSPQVTKKKKSKKKKTVDKSASDVDIGDQEGGMEF